MMEKGFLSACMIVKNEEANIKRCLESIKNLCDEIIIVDTGSKDATVEIAKEYTDKIYFFEWTGNFSEARNESLKYATGEWIFIIDADEEASEELVEKAPTELKKLDKKVEGVRIPNINYLDVRKVRIETASNARFFRNGTVKYENIVHNQPVVAGEVIHLNLPLYHYGYIWTRIKRKEKTDRTLKLIETFLEKNPDNLYYLIQYIKTLRIANRESDAYEWAAKTEKLMLETINKNPNYIPSPMENEYFSIWGNILVRLGYLDKAERILNYGKKWNPDCYMNLASIYEKQEKYEELLKTAKDFLKILPLYLNNKQLILWSCFSIYKKNIFVIMKVKANLFLKNYQEMYNSVEELEFDSEKIDNVDMTITKDLIHVMIGKFLELREKKSKDIFVKTIKCLYDKIPEYLKDDQLKRIIKIIDSDNVSIIYEFVPEQFDNISGLTLEIFNSIMLKGSYYEGLLFIKSLKRIRKNQSNIEQAILQCLLGDLYLKLGKMNEALSYYKNCLKMEPSLHEYLAFVVEDLMITMKVIELEPAYKELYEAYIKHSEILFKLEKFISDRELAFLDYKYGDEVKFIRYYDAILNDDKNPEISEAIYTELLEDETIEEKRKGFIAYRLYRMNKKNRKYDEAHKFLRKSLYLNPRLGDYKNGTFTYTDFYFYDKMEERNDKMYYVTNFSENVICPQTIDPIKVWYEFDEYYAISPAPSLYALKETFFYYKNSTDYLESFNNPYSNYIINSLCETGISHLQYYSMKELKEFEKYDFIRIPDFNEESQKIEINENILIMNPEFFYKVEDIKKIITKARNIFIYFNLDTRAILDNALTLNYWNIEKIHKFIKSTDVDYSLKMINNNYVEVKIIKK